MSQFKCKKIVKEKMQVKVLVYLVTLQNKHTKSENLHLDSNMQYYLRSYELTLFQKELLFLLRLKCLPQQQSYLCTDPRSDETENLLSRPSLMQDKVLGNEFIQVKYKDVFGNINNQKKCVQVCAKVMAVYEKNKTKESA